MLKLLEMKVLSEKIENRLFIVFLILLVGSIYSYLTYGYAPLKGVTFSVWFITGMNYWFRKFFNL